MKVRLPLSEKTLTQTMLLTPRRRQITPLFTPDFWNISQGVAVAKSGKQKNNRKRNLSPTICLFYLLQIISNCFALRVPLAVISILSVKRISEDKMYHLRKFVLLFEFY
ncbi:MAG: hypothetical protein LBS01_04015 [Prevotellaceae bacterium]|jgi:hypothetical protein|nr:hypothetical protein [Prevotellaceae bacterium]